MTFDPGSTTVHPAAMPVLHLARHAARGHEQIAEAVREYTETAHREREEKRAALAATRHAQRPPEVAAGHE